MSTEELGGGLTFVTVVYEVERPLLRLQARSMGRYLDPRLADEVLVIDNSRRGMPAAERDALLAAYGDIAPAVSFLRPDDLGGVPRTIGYRSQQILKLTVADRVRTSRYVVLDAKNHLVGSPSRECFVAPDGRIRVNAYGYERHPHRHNLERVLAYLGLDPAQHIGGFTATVPPFVMDTATARALVRDVAARAGRDFATEFLERDLTEFFLYTGWLIARGEDLHEIYDFHQVRWPIVWPFAANRAGVARAIADAGAGAPLFAVHRLALAELDEEGCELLAEYWAARGLFGSADDARSFIEDFQRSHRWQTKMRRLRDAPTDVLSKARRMAGLSR